MTGSDEAQGGPAGTSRPVCPFCAAGGEPFAPGRVLNRHDVQYERCASCASIFLPSPHWLDQAYESAIAALDVGLLERCLQLANVTDAILASERMTAPVGLDFAGGYGTLTRLLRDRGRDFRHLDPYCENVFAKGHEGGLDRRYDLVTAFEVLEHLTDPAVDLAGVARATDLLVLTTQVLPEPAPQPGEWEYYTPLTGQHISFATVAGLEALAERLGYRLTTTGRVVHVLHRRPLRRATALLLRDERLAYAVGAIRSEIGRRRGLTRADATAAETALTQGRA